MIPLVRCPNCGAQFKSTFQAEAGTVFMMGNIESCPNCSAMCRSPEGVFELGSALLREVRTGAVDRHGLEIFRDVAEAVKSGTKSADQGAAEIAEVSDTFASLLKLANDNPAVLAILALVISSLIAYYAIVCANQGSAEAHADAQAQIVATHQQTNELRKLNEGIAQLDALSRSEAEARQPTASTPPLGQPQMQLSGALSRQQRRRLAQLTKKSHSPG